MRERLELVAVSYLRDKVEMSIKLFGQTEQSLDLVALIALLQANNLKVAFRNFDKPHFAFRNFENMKS